MEAELWDKKKQMQMQMLFWTNMHLHWFYVTDNYGQQITYFCTCAWIIWPFLFGDIANTPCFLCNLLLSGLCKFKPGHTKWFIYILWVTKIVVMSGRSVAQILMSDFLLWGYMKEKLNWTQNHDHVKCVTQVPVFALWQS
jgi:hypothetical protein